MLAFHTSHCDSLAFNSFFGGGNDHTLINFRENQDTRKFSIWILWNVWVIQKHPHISTQTSLEVYKRFLNQHFCFGVNYKMRNFSGIPGGDFLLGICRPNLDLLFKGSCLEKSPSLLSPAFFFLSLTVYFDCQRNTILISCTSLVLR